MGRHPSGARRDRTRAAAVRGGTAAARRPSAGRGRQARATETSPTGALLSLSPSALVLWLGWLCCDPRRSDHTPQHRFPVSPDAFDRGLVVFPIDGRWGLVEITPEHVMDLRIVAASGLPHEAVRSFDSVHLAVRAATDEAERYTSVRPGQVVFVVTDSGGGTGIKSWGPVTAGGVRALLSSLEGLSEIQENLLSDDVKAAMSAGGGSSQGGTPAASTDLSYSASPAPGPPLAPTLTISYAPDAPPPDPFVVTVAPGTAPDEAIAEVLAGLSHLYRQMGGSGITFELQGVAEVPAGEGSL